MILSLKYNATWLSVDGRKTYYILFYLYKFRNQAFVSISASSCMNTNDSYAIYFLQLCQFLILKYKIIAD